MDKRIWGDVFSGEIGASWKGGNRPIPDLAGWRKTPPQSGWLTSYRVEPLFPKFRLDRQLILGSLNLSRCKSRRRYRHQRGAQNQSSQEFGGCIVFDPLGES